MALWIDDERDAPEGYTVHAKTSEDAVRWLDYARETLVGIALISFDHDLGGDDTTRKVVYWMINENVWPDQIRIHTANPVGRSWLIGTLEAYAPESVKIDPTDPWRDPRGMRMA